MNDAHTSAAPVQPASEPADVGILFLCVGFLHGLAKGGLLPKAQCADALQLSDELRDYANVARAPVQPAMPETVESIMEKIGHWGNAPLDTPGDELARRYEVVFEAIRSLATQRDELEAQHESDVATMSKQAVRISEAQRAQPQATAQTSASSTPASESAPPE